MKKIISLLSILIIFNSCDDGELTVQDINFKDVEGHKCSLTGVIYKLKSTEALLLQIPESENAFINEPTGDTPRIIILGGDKKVIYRSYAGTIDTNNVCATILAATPNVTEEWTATSGTVEILTEPSKTTNATTNATTITGYNHTITFKNITFNRQSGTPLQYETFEFGKYKTTATTLPFNFATDPIVVKCSTSNDIYDYNGSESLIVSIPSSLYPNASGTQSTLINATNKVTYTLFNSILPNSYFCNAITPATPTINQQWIGVNGVLADATGIIEVETTSESATTWKHIIHLKKVTFKKGESTFTLGDDYEYGYFITN
jgi:hypothetical protein